MPTQITTDQGRQFESALFRELSNLIGAKHVHTTPYHPCANGLIERWHRTLKAALMCHQESWSDALPAVLLGLRCTYKDDISATPAELVYGSTIRLPGEFFSKETVTKTAEDYVTKLRNVMQGIRPVQTSAHATRNVFVHPEMSKCTHVFVRNDAVKPPLQPPYDGPYRILERTPKVWKLSIKEKEKAISIDRLKPAFGESEPALESSPTVTVQGNIPLQTTHPNPETFTTTRGRQVRFVHYRE